MRCWGMCALTLLLLGCLAAAAPLAYASASHALVAVHDTEAKPEPPIQTPTTTPVPAEKLRPFIPTNEWQTVENDHALPAGLHVRINFQTGVKEARLMEEQVGVMTLSEKRKAKLDLMAPYITDHLGADAAAGEAAVAHADHGMAFQDLSTEVEQQWRPVRAQEGDIGIMQRAIAAIGAAKTDEDLRAAIEPLEEVVDQLENAKEFKTMGGLITLLHAVRAAAGPDVRSLAARVLGLACQNNKDVQDELLDHGALPVLLPLLESAASERQHLRFLFALSSLCRSNARALAVFSAQGGVAALRNVAKESPRLAIKALTLLTDLVVDEVSAQTNVSDNLDRSTDLANVAALSGSSELLRAAAQAGWCTAMPGLLGSSADTAEKTLEAMLVAMRPCQKDFLPVLPQLRTLREKWNVAPAATEDDGETFSHMLLALADETIRELERCSNGECTA